MQVRRVAANGLSFEVLEWGSGDRLALCLHGFPELAVSWRRQAEQLAELGYRIWAPNQRGYGRTTRPRQCAAYRLEHLLDDAGSLIDASGASSVTLIGHDWGAFVAWWFAIRRLRPIERLVILNVPHPAVFRARLRGRQLLRSWYAAFFQLPWLPERVLGFAAAAPLVYAIRATSCDPRRIPSDLIEAYRLHACTPGALTAMLDWYRANITGGGIVAQFQRGIDVIDVPTLMLWGERDAALGKETTVGTERYVRDLTLRYLPGVSHWLQHEAPETVNAMLAAFLRGEPVPHA
jgi:pimeloyl-ACP methyl ester carboxylesterase